MRKVFSKAIHAVVTGKTVCPVIDGMCLCENRIDLLMAGLTIEQIECRDALRVAIGTRKRLARDPLLVAAQRKSQLLVRKIRAGGDRQRRVRTAMVGVAVSAFQIRILVVNGSVQRDGHAHVHANVSVTECTAIRHAHEIPRRLQAPHPPGR